MAGRRNRLGTRLLGTIVGAGFCLLGAHAVLGVCALGDSTPGRRVLWYGITLMIAGLLAIGSPWYVEDVGTIWCRRPPRRLR